MHQSPMSRIVLSLGIAVVLTLPATAETSPAPAMLKRPETGQHGAQARNTQARDTKTQATDEKRARQWHLSLDKWQRYQHLLHGIDGYRSDKLDPLTLLGMYARSEAEQMQYARKLARLEHDRIQRVLNFQKAYNRAWQSLYPNTSRVRTDRLARSMDAGQRDAKRLGLERDVRTTVIVRATDCDACRQKVQQLASSHTPMDIYVVHAGSDNAIRAWAKKIGLDPARVRSGNITLNHAPSAVAQRLAGQSLPRVIR